MKRTERKYELAVSAAVAAVFAAFWVIVFAMGDPPEFQSQYVFSAAIVAAVARLWGDRGPASVACLVGPGRG